MVRTRGKRQREEFDAEQTSDPLVDLELEDEQSPVSSHSKRKKEIPPVKRSGSSSSLRFRSSLYADKFQSNMLEKQIVMGNLIDELLFSKIQVLDLLESVGLVRMLYPSLEVYPALVKEFYGNMSILNNRVTTYVKHTEILFDSKLLHVLFGVPCSGICPFTLKGPFTEIVDFSEIEQLNVLKNDESDIHLFSLPKIVDCTPMASALHKILRSNLIPRVRGRSGVTYQDLNYYCHDFKKNEFQLCFIND